MKSELNPGATLVPIEFMDQFPASERNQAVIKDYGEQMNLKDKGGAERCGKTETKLRIADAEGCLATAVHLTPVPSHPWQSFRIWLIGKWNRQSEIIDEGLFKVIY